MERIWIFGGDIMLLGEAQRKIETYDIVPDIGELPEKKPKTKLELANKRTRNSTRFINPDGSFTEEIYNQSVFYQDVIDKKWKRIDNTLKKDPLAPDKFTNTANEFKSIFAEESDISKLVSVQKQGYNLNGFTWRGGHDILVGRSQILINLASLIGIQTRRGYILSCNSLHSQRHNYVFCNCTNSLSL
jgi:hypothetical protein